MRTNVYIKDLDSDVADYLRFKSNESSTPVSRVLEGLLLDSPKFRDDFSTFLSFPQTKPKMVIDWDKKRDGKKIRRGSRKKKDT